MELKICLSMSICLSDYYTILPETNFFGWLRYLPMVLAASASRELDFVLRLECSSSGVRGWSAGWSPPSHVRSGSVRVTPHASMDSRLAISDRGFMDRAWGKSTSKKHVFIQKEELCGIEKRSIMNSFIDLYMGHNY